MDREGHADSLRSSGPCGSDLSSPPTFARRCRVALASYNRCGFAPCGRFPRGLNEARVLPESLAVLRPPTTAARAERILGVRMRSVDRMLPDVTARLRSTKSPSRVWPWRHTMVISTVVLDPFHSGSAEDSAAALSRGTLSSTVADCFGLGSSRMPPRRCLIASENVGPGHPGTCRLACSPMQKLRCRRDSRTAMSPSPVLSSPSDSSSRPDAAARARVDSASSTTPRGCLRRASVANSVARI